jgi:hypothetical protein
VKGKSYLCPISLLPLQNPRSSGTSPLGLTFLKRKNHPIMVTLGGIGSCYASLAFYLIAFSPSYKLCDNRVDSAPRYNIPLESDLGGLKMWQGIFLDYPRSNDHL